MNSYGYSILILFAFDSRCQNGAEFLFQAKDDDEMNIWLGNLRKAISMAGGGGSSSSKSQTMPAGQSADEQQRKKGGFLTFKRQ